MHGKRRLGVTGKLNPDVTNKCHVCQLKRDVQKSALNLTKTNNQW